MMVKRESLCVPREVLTSAGVPVMKDAANINFTVHDVLNQLPHLEARSADG